MPGSPPLGAPNAQGSRPPELAVKSTCSGGKLRALSFRRSASRQRSGQPGGVARKSKNLTTATWWAGSSGLPTCTPAAGGSARAGSAATSGMMAWHARPRCSAPSVRRASAVCSAGTLGHGSGWPAGPRSGKRRGYTAGQWRRWCHSRPARHGGPCSNTANTQQCGTRRATTRVESP